MQSNIKTIVEEHVSSDNVATYILLVNNHDEVAMHHHQTN